MAISTHTPHAGRDEIEKPNGVTVTISTHTPHAGRDMSAIRQRTPHSLFLLTRPMRGATVTPTQQKGWNMNFYSHAPCGARHTSRQRSGCSSIFLLTRPMRGATDVRFCRRKIIPISTHTPHAGRDCIRSHLTALPSNFYSHAPCGARRETVLGDRHGYAFLLTRPMRGATAPSIQRVDP